MFGKRSRFLLVLLATAGVPYVWFNDPLAKSIKSKWSELSSSWKQQEVRLAVLEPEKTTKPTPSTPSKTEPSSAAKPSANDLATVLRFDISPDWVTRRWPRVSTIQSEPQLLGLRVALVTGTEVDDLAGSLTYYFDKQEQLQRLRFDGHTGDDRKLIALVTSQFGMRPEPTLGAGMYVARWNALPTSVLRVTYAPVMRSDDPHHRLIVGLEINRPERYYGLSRDFAQLLLRDRKAYQW